MLDTEYHKRFPNPVHVEAYKPTAARTDRVVLAEVFTGSGCPPCAGADIAFDAAMERYAPQRSRRRHVSPAHSAARPDDQPRYPGARQELLGQRRTQFHHRRQEDRRRWIARYGPRRLRSL